jgi:hypothetical protein
MKVVANGLHPAIQHRKAVLALSILDVALEQLAPVADKKLRARVDTVQRWAQGCWGPLRRKESSKGFQRDIKASVEALLDAFTDHFGTGSEALAGWSAFYHVGLCLLWDARVASPSTPGVRRGPGWTGPPGAWVMSSRACRRSATWWERKYMSEVA